MTVGLEMRNNLGMGTFNILYLAEVFGTVPNKDLLFRSIPDFVANCHNGGDEIFVS